jgi:ATP diphosphatase
MNQIENLLYIMASLRDQQTGCPWDREQDFASIAPYTIEEAYEVADAIAKEDMAELCEELGDLLFQVVFHAQMATEIGAFDFDAVTVGICNKMIRRHPHVFGNETECTHGVGRDNWELIKIAEKATSSDVKVSVLDGIANSLPALKKAEKLGRRSASIGFDWPDKRGVRQKIDEELEELDTALRAQETEQVTEELGDLLFSVVNLSRHLHIDPEQALVNANRKFEKRFRKMECDITESGRSLSDFDIDLLEARWQSAKDKVAD